MDSTAGSRGQGSVINTVVPFEVRMRADPEAGMVEADRYFQERGEVHATLHQITGHLDRAGVAYGVAGSLAVFFHGLRRLTDRVELLINKVGREWILSQLDQLGCIHEWPWSNEFRDRRNGVLIRLIVNEDFPKYDLARPFEKPPPEDVFETHESIRYVNLRTLIELKLTYGIGRRDCLNDLAEVQELIKIRWLPRDFANSLHANLRSAFLNLWDSTRPLPRRFLKIWEPTPETNGELQAMLADGVTIESLPESVGPLIRLVATDYDIAHKYDMHGEAGFMPPYGTDQDPTPVL